MARQGGGRMGSCDLGGGAYGRDDIPDADCPA